jgi:hypothetical protein
MMAHRVEKMIAESGYCLLSMRFKRAALPET